MSVSLWRGVCLAWWVLACAWWRGCFEKRIALIMGIGQGDGGRAVGEGRGFDGLLKKGACGDGLSE